MLRATSFVNNTLRQEGAKVFTQCTLVAVTRSTMFRRGSRTAVKEAVNAQAEALLSLGGWNLREGTVLVAQNGDDVVGVALLRLGVRDAEVLTVITDANHRHRGIGRSLVLEMIRRAKVAGCRRLHVRFPLSDDAAACGFFRALGFDVTQVTMDLAL